MAGHNPATVHQGSGRRAAALLAAVLAISTMGTTLVGAQVVAPAPAPAYASCDHLEVPQLLTDISTACTGYATGQQCSLACELAMAPAMLGDCKNSVTAIVGDGLAQTLAREWHACLGANAPADVAAAVSAASNCGGGTAPPVPGSSGHRRAQDAIDAVLAMLAAFVARDGSVCAMATALAAAVTYDDCCEFAYHQASPLFRVGHSFGLIAS